MIQKGIIKQNKKVLTKQITYIQINISKAQQCINQNKEKEFKKREWKLIIFTQKLFLSNPKEFLDYVTTNKLFSKFDLINFQKAMNKMMEEEKILESWNLTNKK